MRSGRVRRPVAASIPVLAVLYAWSTLEIGTSRGLFVPVVVAALTVSLPTRPAARLVVAAAGLGGRRGRARPHVVGERGRDRRSRGLRRLRHRPAVRGRRTHGARGARGAPRRDVRTRVCGGRAGPAVRRRDRRCGGRRDSDDHQSLAEHDRDGGACPCRRPLATGNRRDAGAKRVRPRRGRHGDHYRRGGRARRDRGEALGRGARLAKLGSLRGVARGQDGGARLELELQRDRLSSRKDDGPSGDGATSRAVLARNDPGLLRRRPLGRGALLEHAGVGCEEAPPGRAASAHCCDATRAGSSRRSKCARCSTIT